MSIRPRADRALVIDLELTCWSDTPPPDEMPEIIEFGVVEVDTNALSIVREDRRLVRPYRSSVSAFCTSLTGLDGSDLRRHGRPVAEVARTLRKEFGSAAKPWFAWGRDDEAIRAEIADHTQLPFAGPFLDLSLLFGLAFPEQHRAGLSAACAYLGIPWRGAAHRALDDARMAAEILFALLRRARS